MSAKWVCDVVIVTDRRYAAPERRDWYVDQVLTEDGLLQSALEARGLALRARGVVRGGL